jgi:hypothetical protein
VTQYSPQRRTALVLCGTGVHGAYHAGVLRALQEAGVKIDIVAGHGIGAAGATLAAIDGIGRLADANGVWRSADVARLYGWAGAVRVAVWLAASLAVVLLASALAGTLVPPRAVRLALLIWLTGAAGWVVALRWKEWRAPARRRATGSWFWRLLGAPLTAARARALFADTLRTLVHGRGYAEVLAESLGQPGFRELVLIATDLDARRDLVAALLRDPFRPAFFASPPGRERQAEAIDLAAADAPHVLEIVGGAVTPPLACDPHLVTFPRTGFWRGETHRLCDRPGAVVRLLEELAAAGATQAIVVSAVAPASSPHRLTSVPLDLRRRLGDALAAAEAASLRDALDVARRRFDAVYLICPAHNPLGAFDVSGAYDESSDRREDVAELLDRAYADAYGQFIDPVVGASGERLAVAPDERRAAAAGTPAPAHEPRLTLHDGRGFDGRETLLDDLDPPR